MPDKKQIEEMMKKMNMNIKNIDAVEVIIKTKTKNITISKPEIMIANIMGKEVYQITGEIKETEEEKEKPPKNKTSVEKLEELDNDLINAVKELKRK